MAVASANSVKTETSQSMDSSPSGRVSDAASESSSSAGLSSATAADPPNSSPNPPRDLEFQPQASQRSEEYRRLFRLPPEEVLIQDFNCALQENFLLQGHMYVFGHYICFYSNLFGFETKKVIPFHEVTSVRRAKAAGIFPTAIEVMAGGKKYFFTSFLSRDEAFKLMNDGWSQHGNVVKEITDLQDTKLEFNSQENGDVVAEKAKSSKHMAYESDSSERPKEIPIFEDSDLPLEVEDEIVSSSVVQNNMEEDAEEVINNESSSSGKCSAWVEENSDAPKVPDYYTKVAESKFPIRVDEFFNFFYSDDAVDFLESYHEKCGDKEFRCSSWCPHEKFGHARDVSFQHPIKIYFGAKYGSCQEVQKFRVYRNSHLVIETSQEVRDVPYGDYFHVEGLWDVERDGDESKEGCIVRVYVNVVFSKKTMWKGKIVQTTVEEARDAYVVWMKHAHVLLKQKNLEKEEAVLIMNGQIREERQEKTGELLEGSQGASDSRMSQMLPDSEDVNQLVGDRLHGMSNGVTSLASLFRESMLSIVMLLSRPQQVQLIPQPDYMSTTCSLSERMPGTMAWVEKRIDHLKDEMHVIETLLEKMRHEHTFLKAQLEDLEYFRRQQR
ncbi:protein VASCULAR ASSOCIATED DEATH 1, chloroplastic isoform X2 [Camellia sinensis]|uniref:protein VASCULAR ASSOCIATED DEATH 1, chloroplastic isoform X2 n=1 Tax=Camellia sinensis TaxID=4442 RepID=UPI001035605F|nr:protein VASCULAR ASSOCIATED DEATH 1, chloroplastic isoform X2 [Camellia sinensis]